MEQRMDRLFDSGDDFLEHEESGSSLKRKLSYYALPLCVLSPFVAVVLVPGISPMMAVVAAPALLALGALLYASVWAKRNL